MTQVNPNHGPAESLSALVDGELGAHLVLDDLPADVLADWNAYQAIGAVLRAPGAAAPAAAYGADPAFLQRLALRLVNEKIEKIEKIEKARDTEKSVPQLVFDSVTRPNALAANDTTFRWKLVAGLASLSAVAAVAWSLVGAPVVSPGQQLAQIAAGTELVVASPQGPMMRDARLEELLSAHKQLGGTSLQVPSGFLRNAGFEAAQNERR